MTLAGDARMDTAGAIALQEAVDGYERTQPAAALKGQSAMTRETQMHHE